MFAAGTLVSGTKNVRTRKTDGSSGTLNASKTRRRRRRVEKGPSFTYAYTITSRDDGNDFSDAGALVFSPFPTHVRTTHCPRTTVTAAGCRVRRPAARARDSFT